MNTPKDTISASDTDYRKKRLDAAARKAFFAAGAMFLLAGCSQNISLTNQTFVLELGTDVYANPALYLEHPESVKLDRLSVEPDSPGITLSDNRFVTVGLDYLTVGEYDFHIREKNDTVPFVIKIKDTKAPSLKRAPAEMTFTYGQDVNWDEVYGASDLSGVYYEAPSDLTMNTEERDVTIKIRDRFGNAIMQPLHVKVQ